MAVDFVARARLQSWTAAPATKSTQHRPRTASTAASTVYTSHTTQLATGRKTGEGQYVYLPETNQTLAHGYHTSWNHDTGNISSQGHYEAGHKVGMWQYYHPNGQLDSEVPFRNDKRHGAWIHLTTGGFKSSGEYVGGQRRSVAARELTQSHRLP